jgi:hypothetical protein
VFGLGWLEVLFLALVVLFVVAVVLVLRVLRR